MATKYNEFMEGQTERLAGSIVMDLKSREDFGRDDSKDTLTSLASDSIRACLDGLSSGPEPFRAWVGKLLAGLAEKGWRKGDTLDFIAALRRQFIKESMPAIKENIEGAEAGVLDLVWLCDTADHLGFDLFGDLSAVENAETGDVTELKRSEAARSRLQQEAIWAHKQALRELSTPLIPITDEIVVMPLVGPVDSVRAMDILETLLEGVGSSNVDTVIVDLTGVSIIDTQVAEALINAAQAVGLLGAEVLVTGISPHVAQTMVQLGIDLSSFNTLGTLKSGIAHAMGKRERES
jgi:anti-anti-sigma regulatory factor